MCSFGGVLLPRRRAPVRKCCRAIHVGDAVRLGGHDAGRSRVHPLDVCHVLGDGVSWSMDAKVVCVGGACSPLGDQGFQVSQ